MATIQTIEDGYRNLIIKVDGTDVETNAVIVTASTLNPPCTEVSLLRLTYNLQPNANMGLLWDATTPVVAWNFSGSNDCHVDFECSSGIPNNAGAGKTGNVLLNGGTAATPYSLYIEFLKKGVQEL